MRGISTRAIPALFLALPFVLATNVNAQEEAETVDEAAVCTAVLTPAQITANEAPLQLTAVLSEDIGFIGFEAPEESGIFVVAPEDVPMDDMADEENEEAARPISMAAEGNTFVVWVNTLNAQPGSFDVTLTGENGTCTAIIEIEGTEGTN